MAYSDSTILVCRLIDQINHRRKLVDVAERGELLALWREFVRLLDSFQSGDRFLENAVLFLEKAALHKPEPGLWTRHSDMRSRFRDVANEVVAMTSGSRDPLYALLSLYYLAQVSYLLGEYGTVAVSSERCLELMDEAEEQLDVRGRRALLYYRFLLLTALYEASLHSGELQLRHFSPKAREAILNSDKSGLIGQIIGALVGRWSQSADPVLREADHHLRFALSANPQQWHFDRKSRIADLYLISRELRVTVQQYHQDHDKSLQNIERVLALCGNKRKYEAYRRHALLYRGLILAVKGRFQAAIADIESAIEFFARNGNTFALNRCRRNLAEVYFRAFDYRKTETILGDVIKTARENGYVQDLGMAHYLRGRARSMQHRQIDALEDFKVALSIFREFVGPDNVLDILMWCGAALLKWHVFEARARVVSEARGFLNVRERLQDQLREAVREHETSPVQKIWVLEGKHYTDLLFYLGSGMLPEAVGAAWLLTEELKGRVAEPKLRRPGSAIREYLALEMLKLQQDKSPTYPPFRDRLDELAGLSPKNRMRIAFSELIGQVPKWTVAPLDKESEASVLSLSLRVLQFAEETESQKPVINLLDEFSHLFAFRSEYLACLTLWLQRLGECADPVSKSNVEKLRREISEFLCRERLIRLASPDFSFLSRGPRSWLGDRLAEKGGTHLFKTLYTQYSSGCSGQTFGEILFVRAIERNGQLAIEMLESMPHGAVRVEALPTFNREILKGKRKVEISNGMAFALQAWKAEDGEREWRSFQLRDVTMREIVSDEFFAKTYTRLQEGLKDQAPVALSQRRTAAVEKWVKRSLESAPIVPHQNGDLVIRGLKSLVERIA